MPTGPKKSNEPPAEPARAVEAQPEQPKHHFGPIPKQLLADPRHTFCAKVIYAFVKMTHALSNKNGCELTLAEIAAGIGADDEGTISTHLARLTVTGYLRHKDNGRGRAAKYWPVDWDLLPPVPVDDASQPEKARPGKTRLEKTRLGNLEKPGPQPGKTGSTTGKNPSLRSSTETQTAPAHSGAVPASASSLSERPRFVRRREPSADTHSRANGSPAEALEPVASDRPTPESLLDLHAKLWREHNEFPRYEPSNTRRHAERLVQLAGADAPRALQLLWVAEEEGGLGWVSTGNKTIEWLTKPANWNNSVLPALKKRKAKRAHDVEWKGSHHGIGQVKPRVRHG